jgi:hypothetical protein
MGLDRFDRLGDQAASLLVPEISSPSDYAKNAGKSGGRAAHDPTQLETPFDFDRLEAGVAGSTAL